MYELISKYLDMKLKDAIEKKAKSGISYWENKNGMKYFGFYTEKPNGEGVILINIPFIKEVEGMFSLTGYDTTELVGAYVVSNYYPKYNTNYDLELAHII